VTCLRRKRACGLSDDAFDILEAQRRVFASSLKPLERLVALALIDHWSTKSPRPFASVTRLEHWTGLSRHPVIAALKGLRGKGAILVSESKNGSRHTYDLTPLMRLPVHEVHRSEPSTSAPKAPVTNAPPVHEVHRTSARGAPPPVHEVHSKEPNKEPNEGTQRSRAGARKRSAPSQVLLIAEPEQSAPDSEHQTVCACYFETFKAQRGEDPVFGPLEGKAIKDLLRKAGTAERACEFIKRAFKSFRAATVTIQQIAKDPSAFVEEKGKGFKPQAVTSELDHLGRGTGLGQPAGPRHAGPESTTSTLPIAAQREVMP
jgi:hypothetical protein